VPILASGITSPQKISLAVRDTLRGETEDIVFTGKVTFTGKILDDATVQGPKVLQLVVDFSEVSGTGAKTGKKYVTAAQTILHRPLVTLDPIQASFPYYGDGQINTARTALASFAVSYIPGRGISLTSKLTAPTF
jgi:hypothetical protein